jgi:hypothetical protein
MIFLQAVILQLESTSLTAVTKHLIENPHRRTRDETGQEMFDLSLDRVF